MKKDAFSEIKAQEASQRRSVMQRRNTRSARALQRKVSLVGNGAKWRLTNLRQVASAMAKWA